MARARDADHIYAIHHRWLADVLGASGSLLTPGETIWGVEQLEELEACFVAQPDTSARRFLEKLRDQLAQASPAATQLMAELHVVHFLMVWKGAISATWKRSTLDTILSWMPRPIAVPEDVAAAMDPGIAHPGQWAMTHRDTQLSWLIRFARAWKDLSPERRAQLVNDPWELRSFAEGVRTGTPADAARLALLHMAHPDTFEAIVAPRHKQLIAGRYADLGGDGTDVDRQLLAIRAALTPTYGERFEWYHDPPFRQWWRDAAWRTFRGWLQEFRARPAFDAEERDYKLELAAKLRAARDLAVDGDEGWRAALKAAFTDSANNLADWRRRGPFLDWVERDPDASRAALVTLWSGDEEPIQRFRSFLDQVPPDVLGARGDQLNVGSFLLMAEAPAALPPAKITPFRTAWHLTRWGPDAPELHTADVYARILALLDELVRDSAAWPVPLRDRLDAQGAVWSLVSHDEKPDGWSDQTWESFLEWRKRPPTDPDEDEDEEGPEPADEVDDVPLVDHVAEAAEDLCLDREVLDEIVELLDDKRQVVLYGPPGTGKTYLALRLARALADEDPTRHAVVQFHPATTYEDFFEGLRPTVTDSGQVTYERRPGALMAVADAAASDPGHRYILVIDEINRANLPKVFGELLFLLEYRDETARTLYRPTEPFRLPPNLWIIGTMNTADRSVALIDAAMRRRFHFVPFFPNHGPMAGLLERWLDRHGGRSGVATFLRAVNDELLGLVGEHLLIGPSHFMKTDLSDPALERIWTYNAFPLIEEQLWGNREEIDRWRWSAVSQRFEQALNGTAGDPASYRDSGGEPPGPA